MRFPACLVIAGLAVAAVPGAMLDRVSIRLMHKPRGTLGAFPPPLAAELRFT